MPRNFSSSESMGYKTTTILYSRHTLLFALQIMNFFLFSTSKTFINQTVSTTYPTRGYHETTRESFPRKKKRTINRFKDIKEVQSLYILRTAALNFPQRMTIRYIRNKLVIRLTTNKGRSYVLVHPHSLWQPKFVKRNNSASQMDQK